jgi:hypothetical protein
LQAVDVDPPIAQISYKKLAFVLTAKSPGSAIVALRIACNPAAPHMVRLRPGYCPALNVVAR